MIKNLSRKFSSIVVLLSAFVLLWVSPALAQSPVVITTTQGIIGEIVTWSGDWDDIPDDFFLCNGYSKSTTTYSDLYGVLGCSYGCPSGSQFNVPEFGGVFLVGSNQGDEFCGGSCPDLWPNEHTTGGEAFHTLTVTEMPSHNHTIGMRGGANIAQTRVARAGGENIQYYASSTYTGGGEGHNNVPPYLAINYIVRYQQTVLTHTLDISGGVDVEETNLILTQLLTETQEIHAVLTSTAAITGDLVTLPLTSTGGLSESFWLYPTATVGDFVQVVPGFITLVLSILFLAVGLFFGFRRSV